MLEQDEFNAVSFYSEFDCAMPQTFVKSYNVVGIIHKLNIIYFYSLCRFLMVHLSQEYAPEFHAEIPKENFNMVMRCASYEKTTTSTHLKEIKKECKKFDINISEVVELFHSLLNKTFYSYELSQESEYDTFCQILFPNRFEVLDDFSGILFHFIGDNLSAEEYSCVKDYSSVMDTTMTRGFDDSYRGDGEEQEIISHTLNDTSNTGCEEVIVSNTYAPSIFQEGLEVAFNEYKSLEQKYVSLQEENYSLKLQIENLKECLNQQNEEFVDLKKEYAILQEDKTKQDNKLKEFIVSFDM